jgi:hypothetical protein
MYGSKNCILNKQNTVCQKDDSATLLHPGSDESSTRRILITNECAVCQHGCYQNRNLFQIYFYFIAEQRKQHTNTQTEFGSQFALTRPPMSNTLFSKKYTRFSAYIYVICKTVGLHGRTLLCYYNYWLSGHYPASSVFYLKQCFGDWTLLRPEIVQSPKRF